MVVVEGGFVVVVQDYDSFEYYFYDIVVGGDWLCEQDVVDYFVYYCLMEMIQLEQWGCLWSCCFDGSVNVWCFGGMKIECIWFVVDKIGFYMLYIFFQIFFQFF